MRRAFWTGLFSGALLMAPLLALQGLGARFLGTSFVPFDCFDWLARALPGRLVIFGIESLVQVLTALGMDLRVSAKPAEQLMALLIWPALGMVAGAVLFIFLRRRNGTHPYRLGLALAALIGIPATWVSLAVDRTATAGPVISGLWNLALFAAWGSLLALVYRRLVGGQPVPIGAEAQVAGYALEVLDRRRFLLRLGGAVAVVTVGGAVLSLAPRRLAAGSFATPGAGSSLRLPNAADPLKPAPGTRPEYTPVSQHYRIDIDTRPPRLDGQSWRLPITGLVEHPLSLSLEDLRHYPARQLFITLACISNPVGGPLIGTTRWTGVPLRRVLADAGLQPSARYARITSADGFHEVIAVDRVQSDERIMLTYAWDGAPLPAGHGYPLRVYIPDGYGMKQPKWITGIEIIDQDIPGYWVERGWDALAVMQTTSVIDTVAADHAFERGGGRLVPIGGIAHAGDRGISRVEVRVDQGPWVAAGLRSPLSPLTWVIWRYDWPFQAGEHNFTVRCVDGRGVAQIVTEAPSYPSGATGLHELKKRISG